MKMWIMVQCLPLLVWNVAIRPPRGVLHAFTVLFIHFLSFLILRSLHSFSVPSPGCARAKSLTWFSSETASKCRSTLLRWRPARSMEILSALMLDSSSFRLHQVPHSADGRLPAPSATCSLFEVEWCYLVFLTNVPDESLTPNRAGANGTTYTATNTALQKKW